MHRKTSSEAYRIIHENGLLSRVRLEVYDILYERGPLTAGEIALAFRKSTRNNISGRLTEMRDMGCVAEFGTKKCPVTDMEVILWDVTEKLPKKLTQPTRIKCKSCNGKGYLIQEKLF